MRSSFLTLKIIAIVILVAIFWVGLFFISNLVSERQGYQRAFFNEISKNNISPQTIISPYIRVPYTELTTCVDDQKVTAECTQESWMYINADSTQWQAKFDVSDDKYKRTIYRATSYQANLTAEGIFQKPTLQNKEYQWNRAEILFPIHDPRGLNAYPTMQILNKKYTFEMNAPNNGDAGFEFMTISATKYPELIQAIQNGFSYNLNTNLIGLNKFTLIPTSRLVSYQANGNWADTKYSGQNLPFDKTSSKKQFTAKWKNIALGNQNMNRIIYCPSDACIRLLSDNDQAIELSRKIGEPHVDSGLTTEFLDSVNVYSQTDRAIKYGIVIMIITFGCFFLFEVMKSLRIHPIQYSLVAMAQGIFFVLLLSISEYYAFAWAYMVACIACVSLMSWYLYYVMRGVQPAIMFALILSTLYAIMYMLLQSSGKTFLVGSVISFIVLAVVMFITRNIDWYQISNRPERELRSYTPPQ